MSRLRAAVCAVLVLSVLGCAEPGPDYVADNHPAFFVDADGSNETTVRDTLRNQYPHLKLANGEVTLNDRCPVRKVPLNRRLPTLFVNGRPIGFC